MTAKKAVKKAVKKVAKKASQEPEMVSYSMKMVIPTGEYANIQPEIVVKAGTMDEAHQFIAPHMNKIWKEYFNISKRREEPVTKPVVSRPVATVATTPPAPVTPEPVTPPSPVSSVALTKATQAIQSCLSIEAFNLIVAQIKASVKLTDDDKLSLAPLLMEKEAELGTL